MFTVLDHTGKREGRSENNCTRTIVRLWSPQQGLLCPYYSPLLMLLRLLLQFGVVWTTQRTLARTERTRCCETASPATAAATAAATLRHGARGNRRALGHFLSHPCGRLDRYRVSRRPVHGGSAKHDGPVCLLLSCCPAAAVSAANLELSAIHRRPFNRPPLLLSSIHPSSRPAAAAVAAGMPFGGTAAAAVPNSHAMACLAVQPRHHHHPLLASVALNHVFSEETKRPAQAGQGEREKERGKTCIRVHASLPACPRQAGKSPASISRASQPPYICV